MVYLLFCILCVLLAMATGMGVLVFWGWAVITVLWIAAKVIGDIGALLSRLFRRD